MKMNPEIKQKWVARLRSGLYPQGKTFLENNGQFCCLGVLCQIAVEAGVIGRIANSDGLVRFGDLSDPSTINDATSNTVLPYKVSIWADLEGESDPCVKHEPGPRGQSSLSYLNDTVNADFDQIADAIEQSL